MFTMFTRSISVMLYAIPPPLSGNTPPLSGTTPPLSGTANRYKTRQYKVT